MSAESWTNCIEDEFNKLSNTTFELRANRATNRKSACFLHNTDTGHMTILRDALWPGTNSLKLEINVAFQRYFMDEGTPKSLSQVSVSILLIADESVELHRPNDWSGASVQWVTCYLTTDKGGADNGLISRDSAVIRKAAILLDIEHQDEIIAAGHAAANRKKQLLIKLRGLRKD